MSDDKVTTYITASSFIPWVTQQIHVHAGPFWGGVTGIAAFIFGVYSDQAKTLAVELFGAAGKFWSAYTGVCVVFIGSIALNAILLLYIEYKKHMQKRLLALSEGVGAKTITHIVKPELVWTDTDLQVRFLTENRHPQEQISVRVHNVALVGREGQVHFPLISGPYFAEIKARGNVAFHFFGSDPKIAETVSQWYLHMPMSFTLSITLSVHRESDSAGKAEQLIFQFTMGLPPWIAGHQNIAPTQVQSLL